jgi:4,5-dihydroxyphthalate decarboxylase
MHIIAVRKEIYEQHRWVAQSLTKAFLESKALCAQEMLDRATLRYMLPWVNQEIEHTTDLMGKDFWPFGLEPNRKVLETFIAYASEQGLLESELKVEDLFAKETLQMFRV